jgi:hypothetical protein
VEGEQIVLSHCVEHQQLRPQVGEEITEEMEAVKIEIEKLRGTFAINVEKVIVSSTYCPECAEDILNNIK